MPFDALRPDKKYRLENHEPTMKLDPHRCGFAARCEAGLRPAVNIEIKWWATPLVRALPRVMGLARTMGIAQTMGIAHIKNG